MYFLFLLRGNSKDSPHHMTDSRDTRPCQPRHFTGKSDGGTYQCNNHTLSFGNSPTDLMDSTSSPDYKALFQQERERRKHFEDRQKQTTLVEFLRHCHNVLSRPLQVRTPSSSTTGEIPIPKGKHCPTRLEQWIDCAAQQQDIYNSVRRYLQPEEDPHVSFRVVYQLILTISSKDCRPRLAL